LKYFVSTISASLLLVMLLAPLQRAQAITQPAFTTLPARQNKIDNALSANLNSISSSDMVTVIIQLRQRATLTEGKNLSRGERLSKVIDDLKRTADNTQGPADVFLRSGLEEGRIKSYTPFWIMNGFSVTANAATINEIASLPDVLSITPDTIDIVPVSSETFLSNPEQNISLISAPSLWNMGYTGQGIVIASLDSGADLSHPELASRWRGGVNSWLDPFGQHPASPVDMTGHGTWTMGVMLGGDAGGTSIGVAPSAQWIAAKIFNDQGASTATAIHQSFQWLLDPDNNPSTPDAPQIVNNSWDFSTPGCNLEFEPDLQALRAAGILPVFAAGNSGPSGNTSLSPANNPSAFAVGAINNNNLIYGQSSRGPSTCGGSTGVFPDVVAPGVNINTTDLGGFYTAAFGTSLSAPHVAGGLALLLSAYPNISASQQESALRASAVDLGIIGADNTYGYGRLDLLGAFNWIASAPTETPTPTSTSTSTPTSTATPTATNTATPTATTTPLPNNIFSDGFESGNLSAWTSTSGGTRLSVTSGAALVGLKGLKANISGNTPSYIEDGRPANESTYHARFYFNPNGTLTGSTATFIFTGLSSNGATIFNVQYLTSGSQSQIRAGVLSNKSQLKTNWKAVSNSSHSIEIAWEAKTSASFSIYIDGVLVETLTNLDTNNYRLDRIRLGPSGGLNSSTTGTEYFDAFLSTRSSFIGP
jgi:subtilisin family serine protease